VFGENLVTFKFNIPCVWFWLCA